MDEKSGVHINDGDCVFHLYPEQSLFIAKDEKLKAVTEILNAIKKEASVLCSNYLWHNDSFEIQAENIFGDEPVCFSGTLNYGENIEDEWFLVHMLLRLTLRFEGLVVRVADSDGEFLLIEAAEHLPSWVSPETCEGRVFLYNGHVHILPQSFCPPSEDEEPFQVTEQVLQFIRKRPIESQVSPTMEKPIIDRIGTYPEKFSSLVHHAVVYVPVAVAALLDHEPNLVTAAVRAFCDRDLVDLRACRAMKYFPPEQRVLSNVLFTKCSYAMLVSSKYQPDKRTGWNLPAPTYEAYRAHLLGIKLACGFEILVAQAKGSKYNADDDSKDDLSQDPEWLQMKARLEEMNYFRGLLEHSKEYNELLNAAQDFHRQHCKIGVTRKSTGARVFELMGSVEVDVDDLKRREAGLRADGGDDSWMDVSKEQLDEMLTARFGHGPDMVDVPAAQPDDIARHLGSFISQVSGVEGVELPNKVEGAPSAPVRPARGVKKGKRKSVQFSADTKMHSVTSNDQIAQQQNHRVTIEPDGFMHAVQNILDFSIPDDNYWDSEGSGMSSYEDEDEMDLGGLSNAGENNMATYFKEMDRELSATTMGQSFVKKPAKTKEKSEEGFEDIEDFEPVDIDMNALKNILMSYKSQMGEAGPAENILAPLGVNLQDIDADVD